MQPIDHAHAYIRKQSASTWPQDLLDGCQRHLVQQQGLSSRQAGCISAQAIAEIRSRHVVNRAHIDVDATTSTCLVIRVPGSDHMVIPLADLMTLLASREQRADAWANAQPLMTLPRVAS
jgi:hypothetical protein